MSERRKSEGIIYICEFRNKNVDVSEPSSVGESVLWNDICPLLAHEAKLFEVWAVICRGVRPHLSWETTSVVWDNIYRCVRRHLSVIIVQYNGFLKYTRFVVKCWFRQIIGVSCRKKAPVYVHNQPRSTYNYWGAIFG